MNAEPQRDECIELCNVSDLVAGSGVAAVAEGKQIALFYLPEAEPKVYALGNHDPFSGANVLARGLVGDIDGRLVIASPIYKQRFDLGTGECVDDPSVSVPSYPVTLEGSNVVLRR